VAHFTNVAYEIRRLTLPPQTLREKLSKIPEFTGDTSPAALAQGVSRLKDIPVSRFSCTLAEAADHPIHNQNPVVRRAVIHAFTKAIGTVWLVLTPLCAVGLVLGTPQVSSVAFSNAAADSSVFAVFFIRNYSMKRTIVQEGKRTEDGETPPGAVTPATQEVDNEQSEKPRTVEEERRTTASDIEKGSHGSEDEAVDVKHEKADAS